MRRSKLETYIAILSALANKGPMKMTHIMYKANINGTVLRDNLDFLIKQKLVEERTIKKEHTIFAVTQRGINVLKYFKEVTNALPIHRRTSKSNQPNTTAVLNLTKTLLFSWIISRELMNIFLGLRIGYD